MSRQPTDTRKPRPRSGAGRLKAPELMPGGRHTPFPDGFDFERLIHPLDPATFFNSYWEKRPLVVSERKPDYYSELLSTAAFDNLISGFGPAKSNELRVVKDSSCSNIEDYLRRDGTPDLNKLYSAYSRGYTVVLDHCKQHPPLLFFFRNLESAFNHPVSSAVFLTPENARAFGPHLDAVDAFVLQVEGTKRWKVYDSYLPLPVSEPQPVSEADLPPLLLEADLKAGDLLYIPRGFVHEALTTKSSSLHVSVYFNRFTWTDLISSALDSLSKEQARLRGGLPPGFLNCKETLEAVREQFGDMLKLLSERASLEQAVDQLAERLLVEKPPPPDGHFARLDGVNDIEPETVLKRRRGVICRVVRETDSVSIQFSGGKVRGPSKIEAALRFIARSEEFTAAALPGALKDKEKLVLVRRLVREGLLTIVRVGEARPK